MKKIYLTPNVKEIKIDSDISLCLQSPPSGPSEVPFPTDAPFGASF